MNSRLAYRMYQVMHSDTKREGIAGSRSIAAVLSGFAMAMALSTWLCFLFNVGLTVAAFVYLIEILLLSLMGNLAFSTLFSVIAVLCLQFFFARPIFSLQVESLRDVTALVTFVTASILVTSLIQRTRSLTEIYRKQAQLLDLTHDSVTVRDMEDVITYWNNGAEALYGWKKEEVLGKVAQSVLRTRYPVAPGAIRETLFALGCWEGELINTRQDGQTVAVATRWALMRNNQGQPLATLETSTDITERVRKEAALQQVTRLTSVGELGASLAHELAQPLSAICAEASAALRWIDRDTPNLEEARFGLRRLVSEGERLTQLFGRVRQLARQTPPQMTPVEINEVVKDVISLVQRDVLNHSVRLTTRLASDSPVILGDRIQLTQVMRNLIMNGIQAMDCVADRPRELLIELRHNDEGGTIVAVQDSGKGIGAEHIGKIFDSFFTTKPDGMGVGLSICRAIVRAHGGQLHATNNAGYGARFEISLPPFASSAPLN